MTADVFPPHMFSQVCLTWTASFQSVGGDSGESGAEGSLCIGAAYEGGAQEGKF